MSKKKDMMASDELVHRMIYALAWFVLVTSIIGDILTGEMSSLYFVVIGLVCIFYIGLWHRCGR